MDYYEEQQYKITIQTLTKLLEEKNREVKCLKSRVYMPDGDYVDVCDKNNMKRVYIIRDNELVAIIYKNFDKSATWEHINGENINAFPYNVPMLSAKCPTANDPCFFPYLTDLCSYPYANSYT